MGANEREVDVVVVGAGPAGEVCAGRLGPKGLEVAIVEEHLVGGECSFYGCMPSKALLRPAQALAEVRRVPGAAEAVTGSLDADAALARRTQVIAGLNDDGQLPWLADRDVELVRGRGRLEGERRVRVGDEVLLARRAVVLAPGTHAAVPPIEGLREARPWTNREAVTAERVPASLLVLGGGPIGAELAQAWASLGARVTVVEAAPRILGREEPFASEQVADAMREDGIELHVGVKAVRAGRTDDGFELELEDGTTLRGEQLLVAVGRRPLTDDLGLDTVGVEPGRGGYVEVDDTLRVPGRDWLYVLGDANGRSLLTHMGKYQARVAADRILGDDSAVVEERLPPPRVTFTEPQVAAVGHTAESAVAALGEQRVRCVDVSTAANAGASFYGRGTAGTSRLVVDEERQVVVGATFVGADVQDFLHAATIAVTAEVPLGRLVHAVPSFPTRSEVWLKLLEEYGL